MTISDWQNSSSTFRVQNENYLGEGLVTFSKTYRGYDGFIKQIDPYYGLNWLGEIDNTVRFPASVAKYRGNYSGMCTDGYGITSASSTQMLGAVGYINSLNEEDTNILDYTPRLYAELVPLHDFISTDLSGYGQFWIDKFIFDTYPADKTYGFAPYVFDPDSIPAITGDSGYYVLRSYQIYTNKSDGTEQDLLFNSFSTISEQGIIYDTWTPLKRLQYGSTSYTRPEGVVYYPYVHQYSARLGSSGTYWIASGSNSAIGQAGLMGANSGNLLTGVNVAYAFKTNDGQYNVFSENPFVNKARMPGGTDANWGKLTTNPFTNHSNSNNVACRFVIASLAEWKKILKGSGMPWSTNLEDVIKPGDEDLDKPDEPGQPDDPVDPGDDGDGDNTSDDIPLPDVKFFPNNNAYNRYWIKSSDLTNLQDWIFGETFLNDIRRLWNDPAEYLINISFYPFNGLIHDPSNVATSAISIGNLTSEISANMMLNGYSAKFNGGSLKVAEYYGSYLDYAPYTSAEIYIPYIGYRQLNINDIMNKTLELIYVVDWDTNQLTATIIADDRPLTVFSGSFGIKLALSGTNANQVAETISRGVFSTLTSTGYAIANGVAGNVSGAVSEGMNAGSSALNTALDVQVSPRQFGHPTPATGLYNTQIPHLIIHRPIKAEPSKFISMHGYSAGYSGKVSDFSGFLKCSAVDLKADETISEQEQQEITNLLLGGIYCG